MSGSPIFICHRKHLHPAGIRRVEQYHRATCPETRCLSHYLRLAAASHAAHRSRHIGSRLQSLIYIDIPRNDFFIAFITAVLLGFPRRNGTCMEKHSKRTHLATYLLSSFILCVFMLKSRFPPFSSRVVMMCHRTYTIAADGQVPDLTPCYFW
ncbi:hypothetical protein F4823DRAFT_449209 [Ustulina deusta]|nr:hypothetical protein F4823DRAFT_449209 [Ustulina deusta]